MRTNRVSVVRNIAGLIIGVFFAVVVTTAPVSHNIASVNVKDTTPSPIQTMITEYHCWMNDGNPHPVAHHVVVYDNAGRPFYMGQRMVNRAIDALLFHKGSIKPLIAVAFCR